ncbi:pyridoxal-5'-phosphate dependent enzyme family (plasmid) [Legionella adelaidensis]|uniref:Pyridoxal phosphate homeostasis protein n=1 Tax=Legionella adelaidensis TaxID=45056 RepID=A0A0W0R2Z1_9GAMM|nr:pyridoxal-5'-phosphate dependent enzyme family transporter protein [Legionella adelaidensis]VEH84752.1 pyridoxal-5'-phosphate dependent enzyme family [Legionella adelaidensis]
MVSGVVSLAKTVAACLSAVREKIHTLELTYGRAKDSVRLVAVSKQQPVTKIIEAYHCGQRDFAESYVQEAQEKINALSDYAINWHFIGSIQSNKIKTIASSFHWVHSVSSFAIAQKLSKERSPALLPMNICIQVNLDREPSKTGVYIDELIPLVKETQTLPHLTVRGLMCIPKPCDASRQYHSFLRLRILRDEINNRLNCSLDTLSMGMSSDLEAAINAGSTMVRVGEAIFGKRENTA